MFLNLKSLFFDTIFLKKSLSLWGAETPFRQKFSVYLSPGDIALKFAVFCAFKFELLISLDWSLLDNFWGHFWATYVFRVFTTEIIVFWLLFFGKDLMFLRGREAFPGKKFPKPLSGGYTDLKFRNFWLLTKIILLLSLD